MTTVVGENACKSKTGTYRIWAAMKQRCQNPNSSSYRIYGGRGIRICDRWQSFENFLEDMGERPAGHSIDRIDNDGNYEPGNCRWATRAEQGKNKRPAHLWQRSGEKRPASPSPTPATNKLIDDLGGPTAVADIIEGWLQFRMRSQAISNWKRRGIPFRYRPILARAAGERGVAVPPDFLVGEAAPVPATDGGNGPCAT